MRKLLQRLFYSILATLLLVGIIHATQIITTPLPYIFSNNTVADATQVNTNLNTIVNGVNNNAQPLQAHNTVTGAVYYLTTGTTGSVTITNSYNIASIIYSSGSHAYTATFTNGNVNNNYAVNFSGFCHYSAGGGGFAAAGITSQSTTQFAWEYFDTTGNFSGNAVDCDAGTIDMSLQVVGGF